MLTAKTDRICLRPYPHRRRSVVPAVPENGAQMSAACDTFRVQVNYPHPDLCHTGEKGMDDGQFC